jgi:hypothetical protein
MYSISLGFSFPLGMAINTGKLTSINADDEMKTF